MKIKQVEELVGITKKNIRFYEDQGLLSPERSQNGYREYHEQDVKRLKQIRFLRKLAVPIEEIRAVLMKEQTLEECLNRQIREIGRQRSNLDAAQSIAESLLTGREGGENLSLDSMDVDSCLEKIARFEKEGREFMDVNVTDIHRKKTVGSVIGASIMIAIMVLLALLIFWGNRIEPLPAPVFIGIVIMPLIIIVCIVVVLVQRIHEIQGGEEDEASKY